jgi:hypothetical protein
MNISLAWFEWHIPIYLLADMGKREYIERRIAGLIVDQRILEFKQLPPDEYGRCIKYAFLINANNRELIENSLFLPQDEQ